MRLLDAIRTANPVLADQLQGELTGPNHYQDRLPKFLRDIRPRIVVETGVATGISTDRILSTLDEIDRGDLYSIDPSPRAGLFEVEHLRWRKRLAYSQDVMADLFMETGPWDVFLHDSDHGAFCQTFEYELAWRFIRPGGYILSDDYEWESPPHHAWKRFCERHAMTFATIGNCAVVRKGTSSPIADHTSRSMVDEAYRIAMAIAHEVVA